MLFGPAFVKQLHHLRHGSVRRHHRGLPARGQGRLRRSRLEPAVHVATLHEQVDSVVSVFSVVASVTAVGFSFETAGTAVTRTASASTISRCSSSRHLLGSCVSLKTSSCCVATIILADTHATLSPSPRTLRAVGWVLVRHRPRCHSQMWPGGPDWGGQNLRPSWSQKQQLVREPRQLLRCCHQLLPPVARGATPADVLLLSCTLITSEPWFMASKLSAKRCTMANTLLAVLCSSCTSSWTGTQKVLPTLSWPVKCKCWLILWFRNAYSEMADRRFTSRRRDEPARTVHPTAPSTVRARLPWRYARRRTAVHRRTGDSTPRGSRHAQQETAGPAGDGTLGERRHAQRGTPRPARDDTPGEKRNAWRQTERFEASGTPRGKRHAQ